MFFISTSSLSLFLRLSMVKVAGAEAATAAASLAAVSKRSLPFKIQCQAHIKKFGILKIK